MTIVPESGLRIVSWKRGRLSWTRSPLVVLGCARWQALRSMPLLQLSFLGMPSAHHLAVALALPRLQMPLKPELRWSEYALSFTSNLVTWTSKQPSPDHRLTQRERSLWQGPLCGSQPGTVALMELVLPRESHLARK
ncbi:hypothetical protein CapIbe_002090 [Capra ibex]